MDKILRTFDGIGQPLPILQVHRHIAHPRVKHILVSVFSQKDVAEDSDQFRILEIGPKFS